MGLLAKKSVRLMQGRDKCLILNLLPNVFQKLRKRRAKAKR